MTSGARARSLPKARRCPSRTGVRGAIAIPSAKRETCGPLAANNPEPERPGAASGPPAARLEGETKAWPCGFLRRIRHKRGPPRRADRSGSREAAGVEEAGGWGVEC